MINIGQLVQDVIEGSESPFKALYLLKQELTTLKEAIEVVEIEAFNQSEYEDKSFIKDGYKIEKRNGGKRWNFKGCKDYQIAKDNLSEIEDGLKTNYKLWESGKSSVDEFGEIGDVPKVTYSKDSMIIKKVK
jgi:hypothetical protein